MAYREVDEVQFPHPDPLLAVWSLVTAVYRHCVDSVGARAGSIHVGRTNSTCDGVFLVI